MRKILQKKKTMERKAIPEEGENMGDKNLEKKRGIYQVRKEGNYIYIYI